MNTSLINNQNRLTFYRSTQSNANVYDFWVVVYWFINANTHMGSSAFEEIYFQNFKLYFLHSR